MNYFLSLLLLIFSGCTSQKITQKPEDTKLYKTWSHIFLIEMGNGIANCDFETYAYYMNEYEESLKEEHKRRISLNELEESNTRYGDTEHEYYIQTTMKMAEANYEVAYFYFTRYLDVMQNRFLYNQDWKPIPNYTK
tara:strand:- start:829 stop:1239 length:411 start_codon:yes stop_codon:yes gene_type:complete